MAKTLGEQLDEIQDSLSAVRKAISYQHGDREVKRSYDDLLAEKEAILKKIERYGRDYVEGANTAPTRRGPTIKKAVWK